MKSKISVLGCGWLGFPLAKALVNSGHLVKGSTTTKEKLAQLAEAQIEPFEIVLEDHPRGDIAAFLKSELLILNIPPGRNSPGIHGFMSKIEGLLPHIRSSDILQVIFISSTSVYGNLNKDVDENSDLNPERESGRVLVQVESLLKEADAFGTTILRLGGLIGPDRLPGRFLAGKKGLKNGEAPVNLLHLDDAMQVIQRIVNLQKFGGIYNVCAPSHPARAQFYTVAAQQLGLEPPTFNKDADPQFKKVLSHKIQEELNYTFSHPDLLEWLVK